MKLGVVILNYQSSDVLLDCLASLPKAFSGPIDCVVVDNASPEGPPRLPHLDGVRLRLHVNERNLGFGRGFNSGVGKWGADCDYIALLNPDLVLEPRSLTHLINFLSEDERRGMVGPRVVHPSGEEQSFAGSIPSPPSFRALLRSRSMPRRRVGSLPIRCEILHGSAMVLRRCALEAIGGMPEETFMYGEEILIGARLKRAGYQVWLVPEVKVVHLDDVSADRAMEPLQKTLRKRSGHIEARRAIWSSCEWRVWNLSNSLTYVRFATARWIAGQPDLARRNWRLAKLHIQSCLKKTEKNMPI